MTEGIKVVSLGDRMGNLISPAVVVAAGAPSVTAGKTPTSPSNERKTSEHKNGLSDSPFSVAVTDVYDGPLDLLLDLIRKQDIDIYDIPIAKITAQ